MHKRLLTALLFCLCTSTVAWGQSLAGGSTAEGGNGGDPMNARIEAYRSFIEIDLKGRLINELVLPLQALRSERSLISRLSNVSAVASVPSKTW